MQWSRKGAAVLLAAWVLWIASPVVSCFLGASPAQRACCRSMSTHCDSPAMAGESACCQAQPQSANLTPLTLDTSDHAQHAALIVQPVRLPLLVAVDSALRSTMNAPPPDTSPGVLSSLRI